MTTPARPRLGRTIAARRHVADGVPSVLLVDPTSDRTVRLGEREWAVIAAMDGTRGLDGIVVAARRAGAATTEERVAELVGELGALGFLDAGDAAEPSPRAWEPTTPADRPIEALPRHTLACDGRGSCCRLYPTIVFLPRDVARARAALPLVLGGGDDEAAAFTPGSGTVDVIRAPALVDGRCAYLAADGRCGIHAAGGAEAKPFGCRTYPLVFVDDGTSVRVTPRPECACVPASDGGELDGGAPVVPAAVHTRRDLPEEVFVFRLPERVALAPGRDAGRDELAAWSRAVADVETRDAAAAFAALAGAVARGLDAARDAATISAPPPMDPARVLPRIAALGEAAARKGRAGFRSPRDLAQQAFVALETACALVDAAPEAFVAGPRSAREARAEAFHLRATLFGHLLLAGDEPITLADALAERAALAVAARALGTVAELADLRDPAFRWPLALVEAVARGHGL